MIRTLLLFVLCTISWLACSLCQAEPPAVSLTIRCEYDSIAAALDKSRLFNASQGGYPGMKNLNWFPQAYDKLDSIGFKMIRLDHVLNDLFYHAVSRDPQGNLQFDFSRLDRVIQPMVKKGMKPLLCLSYCPDALIPQRGNDGSAPKNMDEWKQCVKACVQHYKDQGQTGWCWEVWNEPDIKWFFRGTDAQYIDMYVKTAEGIKQADPTARVGGAADASVTGKSARLGPLLDYIRDHPSIPLDFISYHRYGGGERDDKPPYDLEWDAGFVPSQLAARGLKPRDIYITEWNMTPAMDAGAGASSDTNRTAAGAAARMYNFLQHPELIRLFYFAPLEGYRPGHIFDGDLGLLTVNYHQKPTFNVFKMYGNLGDTLLRSQIAGAVGDNHATYAMVCKKDSSQKVTALLWNYSDQPAAAHLILDKLPYTQSQKNIVVQQYQVDADHGNFYKDRASGLLGYQVGPTEDLVPTERRVIASAAVFNREITLPPFSVIEVVLQPAEAVVPIGTVTLPQPPMEINLAVGKPVISSSSLDDKVGWAKEYLVDELTHSLPGTLGWRSAGHDSPDNAEWVCVDLGKIMPFDMVKLFPRDDTVDEGGGFPVDFKIQVSDDNEHWSDLVTRTNFGEGRRIAERQEFAFERHDGRFVRVYATKLGKTQAGPGKYGFQLAELEIYRRND